MELLLWKELSLIRLFFNDCRFIFLNRLILKRILQTGDIVLDVDGNETRSVLELKSFIYAGFRIRGACQLLVQRQDMNAKRIM